MKQKRLNPFMLKSSRLQTWDAKIARYRELPITVLILGERGTGKQRVAESLHRGSANTFHTVNCAEFGQNLDLMKTSLFGVSKGAFTGADRHRNGIFDKAALGTVFLDEIHTLSLVAQQALLRVLQYRTYRPVGEPNEKPLNCRILAAAQPELIEAKTVGRFRSDLFDRLHIGCIQVPPLRERKQEIASLIRHFCQRYKVQFGEDRYFSAASEQRLTQYDWPGNIRELENFVMRMCVESSEPIIEIDYQPIKSNTPPSTDKIRHTVRSTHSIRTAAAHLGIPKSTLYDRLKREKMGKTIQFS